MGGRGLEHVAPDKDMCLKSAGDFLVLRLLEFLQRKVVCRQGFPPGRMLMINDDDDDNSSFLYY